jgi:hypothetical protein
MSESSSSEILLPFSPLFAVLQDGMDRMLNVIPRDSFIFIVDGQEFSSDLAEVIALSPKVYANWLLNPMVRSFEIPTHLMKADDFRDFLTFARTRHSVSLPHDRAVSFLSISGHLGNERLSLGLLSSMNSMAVPQVPMKSDSRGVIFDLSIDACASSFDLYSADHLRHLDPQSLHRLLSSKSLALHDEDSLLRVLVDLKVDPSEFFHHLEPQFLSSEGLSEFATQMSFDNVTADIWRKVLSSVNCTDRSAKWTQRYPSRLESKIVSSIPFILSDFMRKKWTLEYRGSRDGFRGADFHTKCNGRSNTVTFVETTKGFIFGGFTPIAWESSDRYKEDPEKRSFVFTLKNPRGDEPRKFSLLDSSCAIHCAPTYGPLFGRGHEIYVADECNRNTTSTTFLGRSYVNDTEIPGQEVFAGEVHFTVKQIEVFSIDL